uniref:7TM_GPCR_Srx domain-containing protein n=1 Tax=Angiostrongylus cantonensis TaxID=6313 RepID=A0A158P7N7_ANGCA
MAPSDRTIMLTNIASMWPYNSERRALNWPIHIGLITNCFTSTIIATKINSDMVAFNPKMGFFESIRTCPKSPFVFGVYSSAVLFYGLRQILITPYVFNENRPCSSCMLSRSILISLASGIALPFFTTPYLCHYIVKLKCFRIFNTLDSDPDFARELLISIQLKPTFKQRIMDFLRTVPYFSDVVGKPGPETERLRVT